MENKLIQLISLFLIPVLLAGQAGWVDSPRTIHTSGVGDGLQPRAMGERGDNAHKSVSRDTSKFDSGTGLSSETKASPNDTSLAWGQTKGAAIPAGVGIATNPLSPGQNSCYLRSLAFGEGRAGNLSDKYKTMPEDWSDCMDESDFRAGLTPQSTIKERAHSSLLLPNTPTPPYSFFVHPSVLCAVNAVNKISGVETHGSGPDEIYGWIEDSDPAFLMNWRGLLSKATRGLAIIFAIDLNYRDSGHFELRMDPAATLEKAHEDWKVFATRLAETLATATPPTMPEEEGVRDSSPRFCPNPECEMLLGGDDDFCGFCGTKLGPHSIIYRDPVLEKSIISGKLIPLELFHADLRIRGEGLMKRLDADQIEKNIDPAIRGVVSIIQDLLAVAYTGGSCSGHSDNQDRIVYNGGYLIVYYRADRLEEARIIHRNLLFRIAIGRAGAGRISTREPSEFRSGTIPKEMELNIDPSRHKHGLIPRIYYVFAEEGNDARILQALWSVAEDRLRKMPSSSKSKLEGVSKSMARSLQESI